MSKKIIALQAQDITSALDMATIQESGVTNLLRDPWFNVGLNIATGLPLIPAFADWSALERPNSPAVVTLPGNLNLIPQLGDAIASVGLFILAKALFTHAQTTGSQLGYIRGAIFLVSALALFINAIENSVQILTDSQDPSLNTNIFWSAFVGVGITTTITLQQNISLGRSTVQSCKRRCSVQRDLFRETPEHEPHFRSFLRFKSKFIALDFGASIIYQISNVTALAGMFNGVTPQVAVLSQAISVFAAQLPQFLGLLNRVSDYIPLPTRNPLPEHGLQLLAPSRLETALYTQSIRGRCRTAIHKHTFFTIILDNLLHGDEASLHFMATIAPNPDLFLIEIERLQRVLDGHDKAVLLEAVRHSPQLLSVYLQFNV